MMEVASLVHGRERERGLAKVLGFTLLPGS